MSKTAAKIYYLPVNGGKFKEVQTQEYVQPKVRRKRKKEDPITIILMAYIAIGLFGIITAQICIKMGW